jgi:endo-1,4-beta-xylanase
MKMTIQPAAARRMLTALGLAAALDLGAGSAEVPPLKDVFHARFQMGAALDSRQFTGHDARGAALVKKHFNTITPENIMKWEPIHPAPDKYDFDLADKYVEFGEKNGMKIIGHTLVWDQRTPAWVFEDAGKPASRELLLARMREHIHKVAGRYKNRVAGWDVVNEAIDEDGKMRESKWFKIIGPDFVLKAFECAREADSRAELYYNDYSLENAPKRKGAVRLIQELQAAGIKVAGVGLQGHYKMDWPKIQDIEETIAAFASLGVKCMITELDVDVLPSKRGGSAEITQRGQGGDSANPYKEGLPEKVSAALALRYAELFDVFARNEKNLDRVTFWGVTDGDSWLNNWPIRGRSNYPLLFDRQGEPKKAFHAVVKTP